MTDEPALAIWLRAQIELDRQLALACHGEPFVNIEGERKDPADLWPPPALVRYTHPGHNWPAWRAACMPFIETFNPRRMLADLDARLRIVDLHTGGHECSGYDHHGEIDNCRYYHDFENCSTLRLLAVPYADRDGFQPQWRIDA